MLRRRKNPPKHQHSSLTQIDERAAANAGPEIGDTAGNITILLIDASNLAWADLTYVRGQILRFLRVLPVNERVAFYVLQTHGFQVLEEGTVDHALLAAKLSEWMPSSQDLTRAQAEERRNRQQMDTVRNQSDPQTVNGTSSQAPNAGTLVDPETASIRQQSRAGYAINHGRSWPGILPRFLVTRTWCWSPVTTCWPARTTSR